MKSILDIALKDLQELVRNRMTFLFLLIMPIVFTLLFGFAFSGTGNRDEDTRLPVGFIDQDKSQISLELEQLLERSTLLRLLSDEGKSAADMEEQISHGDLAAAIILPEGYGGMMLKGTPVKLIVILDPSTTTGSTLQGDILAAVKRLQDSVLMAQILSQKTQDLEATLGDVLIAWQDPPIRMEITSSQRMETQQEEQNGYTHSAPGMMLQFAIAGLLTCAQVMVIERKIHCLQRLLTTRVSRVQILFGHYLGIVILLLAQFLLLILFGQLALRLDYFRETGATLLMALTTALCIGGLGLVIGVFSKTEEQAIMFSLIPMMILSGLGGAWMPLEVTGETFQVIGHASPIAWAMDGFKNIIERGVGLESVLIPSIVLVGYAFLFFLIAAWKFQISEEK